VDWNGYESQQTRFVQLKKVISASETFSVNDLGCGYGALYDFLARKYCDFTYFGYDVTNDMIATAQNRISHSNASFACKSRPDSIADFGISSGIFNVRVGRTDTEWAAYLRDTLDVLSETSRYGFSFNCLTSYSDRRQSHLYYSEPTELFDLCKRRYSRDVALLHDYGLYEFTIIVRKNS